MNRNLKSKVPIVLADTYFLYLCKHSHASLIRSENWSECACHIAALSICDKYRSMIALFFVFSSLFFEVENLLRNDKIPFYISISELACHN